MLRLPRDVIETILLPLPAVDLVRCKGVCKAWRSLISSANFVAAHVKRAKSDPSSHRLLLQRPSSSSRPLVIFCLLLVGSVNGLICIAGSTHRIMSPDHIWIVNSATGLSRKLPCSSRVFDERRRNIKFAFWCDDDDGRVYKVAKIVTGFNGGSTLELWVSTSPDTWTVVSNFELDFHLHTLRPFHPCDVLIEGLAAYWICDDESDVEIVVAPTKLVPLSKEQLHMRNSYLPNSVLFGGNLDGEFVLVAHRSSGYDIWTVAASWIKKYTIDLDSFRFGKCLGIVNDKLVLTNRDGRMVLLALCDPLTGMLEVIETGFKDQTINVNSACGFVGSLVSMDGFGFGWTDGLRKNMGISWPYSLHPSVCSEEVWRVKHVEY